MNTLKKKIAAFVSVIALLATSASSGGCFWILADEPDTINSFND